MYFIDILTKMLQLLWVLSHRPQGQFKIGAEAQPPDVGQAPKFLRPNERIVTFMLYCCIDKYKKLSCRR